MGKKGSLKYQIIMDLDKLQMYGKSKHQAKMEEKARCEKEGIPWNPSRVQGIYSIKTYDKYKDICIKFGEWAKREHGIKDLESLKNKKLAKEYLEYRQQAGDSPYSLRLYGSAMAKLLGCGSNEYGFKYPVRSREVITRSRLERFHDKEFSYEKNKDLLEFGKATGLRRTELSLLKPEQIQRDKTGRVIIEIDKEKYGPQSKGAKNRITHVLLDKQEHVWAMREKAITEGRDRVFENVPNRLDEHALRREYAQERYREVIQERQERGIEIHSNYHTRDGSGRHFDKDALREVSNDLGHNRTEVVVKNYLD